MRIDDENKVMWFSDINDLDFVSEKSSLEIVTELTKIDGSYDLCSFQDDFFNGKDFTKKSILLAILNGYRFKLDQPQKYYWRKKKEHLASFEVYDNKIYLNFDNGSRELTMDNWREGAHYKTSFTESEARELLKDDFDKFEKV